MAHVTLIILLFVIGSVSSLRQRRQPNGCGPENGLKINLFLNFIRMGVLIRCCDEHDICYDNCRNIRDKCETEFKQCLQEICDTTRRSGFQWWIWVRRSVCKFIGKVMHFTTYYFGSVSFVESQRNRCHPGISPKSY